MPIIFSCSCGKAFRAAESIAGKRVKCSKCGRVIVVPQPKPKDDQASEEDAGRRSPEPGHGTDQRSPPAGSGKKPPLTLSAGSGAPRRAKQDRPVFDDSAKQVAIQRYKNLPSEKPSTNLLEYGYWLLLLTFIPLAFSLLHERKEDTEDRLVRSLEKSLPPKEEKATPKQKLAPKGKKGAPIIIEEPILPQVSLDDLITRLPGGRIEGALLPRKSFMHWIYALLAGGVFLALTFILFPGARQAVYLPVIALFTATIGILLLLLAQLLAEWTQGRILVSGNFVILLLFWIAWAIGFSYRAAVDPDVGLVPSFLGFTFGVGFCEEVCKVLPLLWYYRVKGALPWRAACAWGFASGVGFGISEGIKYSADFYNGIASGEIYLVRFISCVALHGIWSASAALFIHKFQHIIQADFVWYEFIPRALFFVGIPMILHGMYDTFLKKDMNVLALLTAFASFAWFAWSMERTRRREESLKMALVRSL
jgi:RsiW-degrading membrane proteinase PrsW (M82 family)